jgi:hypothetical protein
LQTLIFADYEARPAHGLVIANLKECDNNLKVKKGVDGVYYFAADTGIGYIRRVSR